MFPSVSTRAWQCFSCFTCAQNLFDLLAPSGCSKAGTPTRSHSYTTCGIFVFAVSGRLHLTCNRSPHYFRYIRQCLSCLTSPSTSTTGRRCLSHCIPCIILLAGLRFLSLRAFPEASSGKSTGWDYTLSLTCALFFLSWSSLYNFCMIPLLPPLYTFGLLSCFAWCCSFLFGVGADCASMIASPRVLLHCSSLSTASCNLSRHFVGETAQMCLSALLLFFAISPSMPRLRAAPYQTSNTCIQNANQLLQACLCNGPLVSYEHRLP